MNNSDAQTSTIGNRYTVVVITHQKDNYFSIESGFHYLILHLYLYFNFFYILINIVLLK